MSINGKVALVTGSTSGIGLGIAQSLARQGAHLMLNGFGDAQAAQAAVQAVAPAGVQVLHHGADMSKPEEIEDLIRSTERHFGRVDILVNNAGIQHVAPIEAFPVDRWDAVIAINLSSAFHTTRWALPGMRQRNWGRIINIASAHGLVASANKSAYVAAKHGLVGMTKSVALETAQVDARAAAEGLSLEDAKKALLAEKQPSLQFTTPEQLGELTVFLCSEAASNLRGAAINVDGGWVAQ
ncbi:MAG: SDR family NAD(P)-dependent oxidoreductase [Betaproteobacteria bacterium]|nr:SDR family NAD(P)-dependent oxidoreductase [Betaproteobacteria bacterium]